MKPQSLEIIRSSKLWLLVTFVQFSLLPAQDFDLPLHQHGVQIGQGLLPFDWSGQVGHSHNYGFSDLGEDVEIGALFLDGSIMAWPFRYAVPFVMDEGSTSSNQSEIVYRWGDYSLNEFGANFTTSDKTYSSRFVGFKRNFNSQLIGPEHYSSGTIQQNYLFDYEIHPDSTLRWQLGVGYFKTDQSLPTFDNVSWIQGASLNDEVLAVGVIRERSTISRHSLWQLAASGQRFSLDSSTDAQSWRSDVLGYRLRHRSERFLSSITSLHLSADVDYSAMSGSGITSPATVDAQLLGGISHDGRMRMRFLTGVGLVGPDSYGVNSEGSLTAYLGAFTVTASGKSWLAPLPPVFAGSDLNTVISNKAAASQRRTLFRLDAQRKSDNCQLKVTFFASSANPIYYFQSLSSDTVQLVSDENGILSGGSWSFRQRLFREWHLEVRGISFSNNPLGWGSGIQHEGFVGLEGRELLFKGNLDARAKVWLNYWSGRNNFVWDPHRNIGYHDAEVDYNPNASAIFNARFTAVISKFEISYTIENVIYAARSFMENVVGPLMDEEITLTPSPYYLPPTRMVYLSIRWQFQD